MPFQYELPVPPELADRGPVRLETRLVEEGGRVDRETPVAIVESGGARFEILANGYAYLLEYRAGIGSRLEPGTALAIMGADGEAIPYGKPYSLLRRLEEEEEEEDS